MKRYEGLVVGSCGGCGIRIGAKRWFWVLVLRRLYHDLIVHGYTDSSILIGRKEFLKARYAVEDKG